MSKEILVELLEEAAVAWDKYIEECFESGNTDEKTYDEFHADYLLANGVIVLPCKVGDVLYVVFKAYNEEKVYPVNVSAIRMDTKKNNNRVCVWGTFHITKFYAHEYKATFKFDSIGKTVFLTREEAEAKLKESKGK